MCKMQTLWRWGEVELLLQFVSLEWAALDDGPSMRLVTVVEVVLILVVLMGVGSAGDGGDDNTTGGSAADGGEGD